MLLLVLVTQPELQTIDDPVGDIPVSDPTYLDISKVKFRQTNDKISVDFYPNTEIPRGNQVGIDKTTIFELYMDVDDNQATGYKIEDIGVDYKLKIDLYNWNGKSWLDGNVYWNYNAYGAPAKQGGFYVTANNLISWRFRWEFSLISLKWPSVKWIARTFYNGHLCDQIPDSGHGFLEIDTSLVVDIDTTSGDYVRFVYPTSFKDVLDQYEVIKAIDAGAQIEGQICGTQFNDILTIQFNPWLEGVAYSGNPVMMGSWSWKDQPSWFIILHELGHNFTLASNRFNQLYPGLGYIPMGGDDWNFGMNYVEAWATMVGFYSIYDLFTNNSTYQLGSTCLADLQEEFDQSKTTFVNSLKTYEESPDFSKLYPDLLDGIFMTLADSFGYDIIPKFFKALQPANETWNALKDINPNKDYAGSKTISMTVTCCMFSVAAGTDLRDEFRNRWDFPISDSLYEAVEPEIQEMMMAIGNSDLATQAEDFCLLQNYPNPFNSATTLNYKLDRSSNVKLKILDLTGKIVAEKDEGKQAPGLYSLNWDASNIASGIYICLLETNYRTERIKMVLLK